MAPDFRDATTILKRTAVKWASWYILFVIVVIKRNDNKNNTTRN